MSHIETCEDRDHACCESRSAEEHASLFGIDPTPPAPEPLTIVDDLTSERMGPFGIVDAATGQVLAVYRSRRGAENARDRMTGKGW